MAIKAQALADFVAEFFTSELPPSRNKVTPWSLHADGASGHQYQWVRILLTSPMGVALHRAITLQFKVTNNQAKYEALIAGLNFALGMPVKHIQTFSDSQQIVNQVNRIYETKDEVLKKYLMKVQSLISLFDDFSLMHVRREENQVADQLAKRGLPDFHQYQTFERSGYECAEIQNTEQTPAGWTESSII
ncbi:hypothetical protein AXF42_Ash005973 [Apostasia shenzhenica]|uniref:RNase H type-1 domain-containing protein n=1 Tax=Apostasia shenzhenica TaxID=1088818 RepID=A0A2I0AZV3_9ASPA|nr:hypothetical protein AXF42_Ash005973 [Apostasia shenzhenica]